MTKLIKKSPRLVCAALRADNGDVLVGIRHYSEDMRIQIRTRPDGHLFKHRHGENQGFVDTTGTYLTRQEAYLVAVENGQLLFDLDTIDSKTLYSENLY